MANKSWILLTGMIWLLSSLNQISSTITVHDFTQQLLTHQINDAQITKQSLAFVPPVQNNKLIEIQKEIKKIKEEIDKLKTSASITNEDRARITNLEATVEILTKLLDNHDKELTSAIVKFQKTIQDLVEEVIRLTRVQEEMRKKLDERDEEEKRKSLLNDIVVDIKSHEFVKAVEKLNRLNDDNRINFIVTEVYRNQEGNFDLLLNFGNSIRNEQKQLLVYKALHKEMLANGHGDVGKLIKLLENLKSTSTEAGNLKDQLRKAVEVDMKYEIKNDLLSGRNATSVKIDEAIRRIDAYDPVLYAKIILDVLKEVYSKTGLEQMIAYVKTQSGLSTRISGYDAVYETMKIHDKLNSQSSFALALALKDLGKSGNYERVKNKLPQCVKNAVFSNVVCIKSYNFNEYLYASASQKEDNERRRVFTWRHPNQRRGNDQDRWILEPSDGNFYIKNYHFKEYIYAAYYGFNMDSDRRMVFSWMPGTREEKKQEYWSIEPSDDKCYIKNLHYNEYFYPFDASVPYDNDRRRVLTWIPKNCDYACLWFIENCD